MMFDVMRTRITIDDDVLSAAKAIARQRARTIGKVVSELARKSLRLQAADSSERNGVPLLQVRRPDAVVTLNIVNALRDRCRGAVARR